MDLFFEDCVCVCTCVFMERSDTLVNSRPSAIPESQYGNERRVLAYAVLIKRFCLPYSYRHTCCLQIIQYAHTLPRQCSSTTDYEHIDLSGPVYSCCLSKKSLA